MSDILQEYVKYLAVTQINHTQTYMGEHKEGISHDKINRFMRGEKIRPRDLWHAVKDDVEPSENGYILFDDTTINKEHSQKIELAQSCYSGAKHGIVTGISVVTCVYVNPELNAHWLIDYRIYDLKSDGRTKIDQLYAMLDHTLRWKKLPFRALLFDTWYADTKLMRHIDELGKIFYAPMRVNRNAFDDFRWQKVGELEWNDEQLQHGREIYLKSMGKKCKTRLFRIERPSRTDKDLYHYIATNDTEIRSKEAVATIAGFRWKIEELHREVKQTAGLERCQCRKARAQRNHIACAFMAWVALKRAAKRLQITIYQLKREMLDGYIYHALNLMPNYLM